MSSLSVSFGDQHMNNTIIRLAVFTADPFCTLYAPYVTTFFAGSAHARAREQMTANAEGIKKILFLWEQGGLVRHLRLSALRTRSPASLSNACTRTTDSCRNATFPLVHSRARRGRFVRRAYLANQHSNCGDCVQLRYPRYNRRRYTPYLSARPLERSPRRCN